MQVAGAAGGEVRFVKETPDLWFSAAPGKGRATSQSIKGKSQVHVARSETHFTMKEERMNKAPSSFMGSRKSSQMQEP